MVDDEPVATSPSVMVQPVPVAGGKYTRQSSALHVFRVYSRP